VSQAALDYVQSSAAVKALPAAEKLVLRQLAMLHKLEVNCAFAGIPDITTLSLIGGKDPQRQCRRILERLEKKGFILRHKSIRNNGSQTSNEYELLGLRAGTAVTEQMRQQVFTTPRTRVAAQLSLSLGDGAVVGGKEDDANGSDSSAVADETPNRSESLAVGKQREVSPHPRTPRVSSSPRTAKVSALDVVLEASKEVILPLPPLAVPVCAKSKSANQEQEQRTTASANATATTQAMPKAEAATRFAGETGMSSGWAGRVIPFRSSRDPEALRSRLDGIEAALFDETMRVLGECGVGPKSSNRRQRNAVEDALRARMDRETCSMAAAGEYLVREWEAYVGSTASLAKVVEARRFFAEGYWQNRSRWDWSLEAKARMVQSSKASVGMHDSARRHMDDQDRAKRQWEAERAQR
jgi:hypothetical protein